MYVNCATRFTFLSVLEAILDVVKPLRSPQRTRDCQMAESQRALGTGRHLVALDEIDIVPECDAGELLYHLTRMPRVSVVCIAPTRRPLLQFPERVLSRFSPRLILFPRYSPSEPAGIVRLVAEQALKPSALSLEALELIGEKAYGDARRGLALLRQGAQEADRLPR